MGAMGTILLSKSTQSQKDKFHVFSYFWILDFIEIHKIMYVCFDDVKVETNCLNTKGSNGG